VKTAKRYKGGRKSSIDSTDREGDKESEKGITTTTTSILSLPSLKRKKKNLRKHHNHPQNYNPILSSQPLPQPTLPTQVHIPPLRLLILPSQDTIQPIVKTKPMMGSLI
jgi:hypothetical protein